MFYSQFILAKKGPLGNIWIAAHLERKLRKNQVADTDIGVSVDSILFPEAPIALRLSSHLLLGVVRIYSRKVSYLFDDCSEALLKIKQAFRSTAVDLPPEESTAPYHSITLPETFDLDDFELPDNDILQGNYVDHHVSTRDQITLQDTMDGMVYSTSQFGLDERFGDTDASQIGLDLDEDLLSDEVTAAGHAVSDADPQGSLQPMTPWEQDNISEQMNETSEARRVNDSVNQLEYADAASTPGLVQEPNSSSGQKALASDDHFESDHNSNELMATDSRASALSKSDCHHENTHAAEWHLHRDSNHGTVQCMLPEKNGYHIGDAEIKQVESFSDMQDPCCETCPGSTNMPVSEACLVDDQVSIKAKTDNDAEITDNVARPGSLVVVDAQVVVCAELKDPDTFNNQFAHEEMASVDMNVLKPCSSCLSEHMSSPGHDNSVAQNLQYVEVEPHSSERAKSNQAFVDVQGEECHVTDIMQSEKSQISGPSVCGYIQVDNRTLDETLDNATSSDNQLKELNHSMSSDLPEPEKLLSVSVGLLDKPNDLLVDSTPEKDVLAGCRGVDAGNTLISGKKRSYTESTITAESLNSSESFGVDRSKTNSEFIPDDDDLLSSILVGRKSSILKLKPTPPVREVSSRKRARSAAQTSALKRKVLMDDTMVLHGDIIRKQLTNTEDIRRIRKKAPCTCPEILMIQIQFLEDDIFSEPIFTGMSAELTRVHCETHDLGKISISENDENSGSSDVANNLDCSIRPNVIEGGGMEGSEEPEVFRNNGETQPAEIPIQTESHQSFQLGANDTDAQRHINSVIDVAGLETVHSEPSLQMDALCLIPELEVDTQPVGVMDRNIEDIVAVETEAKGTDEILVEEGKIGVSVENGANFQTDCTVLAVIMNTQEGTSLETGLCNDLASAHRDNSKLEVMNEEGDLAADLGCDGSDPTSNHIFGEEPAIYSTNSVEIGGDMRNVSLDDGKSQVDLQSPMDGEKMFSGKFEEVTIGYDTEFLNLDDDELAEDYDDGYGCPEDARILESSGWSSRTRAVSKYLQTLFGREAVQGRKLLALDHLLAGKTRKEASRMFFETLVLKTKDYIHVEQAKHTEIINIKPRAKLMKSEF